jgi:protein SCO1/2
MKSRRIGLVLALSSVCLVLGLSPLFAERRAAITASMAGPELFDLGPLPTFELTDQTGARFSSESLQGKVWVADFFLTSCQGACPIMARNMKSLHDMFAGDERVHFVSISVDPETDSPQALAAYTRAYTADNSRWHFLTGPIDIIHRMAGTEGFKVGVPENPMAHSQRFILVDTRGHTRGYFDGLSEEDMQRLGEIIARLLSGTG